MDGALSGAITVVAAVKFIFRLYVREKRKFESQLIQDTLSSSGTKTKLNSLEFLTDTGLVSDQQPKENINNCKKNHFIPPQQKMVVRQPALSYLKLPNRISALFG
jgi:hypothetical protein